MDIYTILYNIRDTLLCLSFLAGAGIGILAITRQQKTIGWLTLIGFLLMGFDPLAEWIVFRVLWTSYTGDNYDIFNWAYVCISVPTYLLGIGCIIFAIYKTIQARATDASNTPIESPAP